MEEEISTKEIEQLTGVHRNVLARWHKQGIIPASRVVFAPGRHGRQAVWPREVLKIIAEVQRSLAGRGVTVRQLARRLGPIRTYSRRQVGQYTMATESNLTHWTKLGIVRASVRVSGGTGHHRVFGFGDLVDAQVAACLNSLGMSSAAIKAVIDKVRAVIEEGAVGFRRVNVPTTDFCSVGAVSIVIDVDAVADALSTLTGDGL